MIIDDLFNIAKDLCVTSLGYTRLLIDGLAIWLKNGSWLRM
jgi:hypothetical protein